jgi:RNA polymerase sigma-70 factor (ECF subfamily)
MWGVVRLRRSAEGRKVVAMDARPIMVALVNERASFLRFARRRVASDADAEDVLQHALLRASQRSASLEDPGRARAWFLRILRNAIADHHRSRPGDPLRHSVPTEVDVLALEPPQTVRACACSGRLAEALRPAYAEVLRRIDRDGEDAAIVARSLGVSPGTLHVRLHRARRALRDRVQRHCKVTSHRPCLDCACDGERRCGGAA